MRCYRLGQAVLKAAASLLFFATATGCLFSDDFTKKDTSEHGTSGCIDPPKPTNATSCSQSNGGAKLNCGPDGNSDCCETRCVPGGNFKRGYDGVSFIPSGTEATLSSYYLDRFQVTVSRFRAWVDSGNYEPADGAGVHPRAGVDSGWHQEWGQALPLGVVNMKGFLKDTCTDVHHTWTDVPGTTAQEARVMNCADWYLAFAFCIWDGGRLASEAEWNYAAAAGPQQRAYPWSKPPTDTTITTNHASYGCELTTCIKDTTLTIPGAHLGSGDASLWGHADLAGNVYDWLLDGRRLTDDNGAYINTTYPSPCNNCVDMLDFNQNEDHRVIRGGGFFSEAEDLLNGARYSLPPGTIPVIVGIRCVRDF